MQRLHLIELHEQSWFPALWRSIFQQGLGKAQSMANPYTNMVTKIEDLLRGTGVDTVLDLCSGSADISIHVLELLKDYENRADVRLILSDLFPSVEHYQELKKAHPETVDYFSEPVDVRQPPDVGPHIRSIIASLHHFHPAEVRAILKDASQRSDGILVLENSSRKFGSILQCALVPLASMIISGFLLRPWRASHLLWNVLIPVLPAVATWDSLVSNLRSYTVGELRAITDSIHHPDFEWEVGTVPIDGMLAEVTYVIGQRCPSNPEPT